MSDPQLNENKPKSSTGLDENIAGLLCYLAGFVSGIIFLILEKNNRTVRFHAMQSIIVFGGIVVLNIVLGFIPIIGAIIGLFIPILSLILWLVLMIKTYQGQLVKLPVVGDIAEKQIDQMKV
jgi:uncharacterized membrane protein